MPVTVTDLVWAQTIGTKATMADAKMISRAPFIAAGCKMSSMNNFSLES